MNAQARRDDEFADTKPEEPTVNKEAFDLVCIGGGIAGLSASVRAAELGLRVVLLEQGAAPQYVCNSRMSGGVFHVSYMDITAPPAELEAGIRDATHGMTEPDLVNAMAQNAGRAFSWLQSKGAKFIKQSGWRTVLTPPRPFAAGDAWVGRGADMLLRRLAAELVERGGEMRLGTRAEALQPVDGGFQVKARVGGSDHILFARVVVIADGGFQSNPEMFRAHIGPAPDQVVQRGAATGHGDGFRMARAIGAAAAEMRGFYGHILSIDALTNEKLRPYPTLDELAASAVVVDESGDRIFDEGQGGIVMANRLAAADNPASATIIADESIVAQVGKGGPYLPNSYISDVGGKVHRANTLQALADLAKINGERLTGTVIAYNSAVRAGHLSALTPPRSKRGVWRQEVTPLQISKPPFVAIPIRPGITHTMGGLAVDGFGRVRRDGGGYVEGLYAVGSSLGGLEGGPQVGYVGGLMKGLVFGLLAAECASRESSTR
jgi:fumarate reductase flavoprotein subunit